MNPQSTTDPLSRDRPTPLAPAQEQLLTVCYDLGPATARELFHHYSSTHQGQLDYNAARYHLNQLVAKGHLTLTKPVRTGKRQRPAARYVPAGSPEELLAARFKDFIATYATSPEGIEVLVRVLANFKAGATQKPAEPADA